MQTSTQPAYQPYLVTIDNDPPVLVTARTGITYDAKAKTEVRDRSFIALAFENDGRSGPDNLDPASIDYTRFLLDPEEDAEPITVVGVTHSTDGAGKGKGLDADSITPAARVYLELSRELGSDETPDVQTLSGAVTDLAGNTNTPSEITPDDRIEPGFAVTVTADVNGRPVIGDDGEFEVAITSGRGAAAQPDHLRSVA